MRETRQTQTCIQFSERVIQPVLKSKARYSSLKCHYHPKYVMRYSALQTLGYLARSSKWERIYNTNRPRKTKKNRCRMTAYRAKLKKSGQRLVVIKRVAVGTGRIVPCGCLDCGVCKAFVVKSTSLLGYT